MKKILLIFTIILSVNSFAQEPEDDDNFDSVTPVYLIDSVYIKYTIKNAVILRDKFYDPDIIVDMARENRTIRIATDDDMSMLLSDTISKLYHASKKYDKKKHNKTIVEFLDNTAMDSSANVLFVRVLSPCEPCMSSILKNILSDNDVTSGLSNRKFKYIYVNYYQTRMNKRNEYIVITFKPWFKRREIYTIYNEKL